MGLIVFLLLFNGKDRLGIGRFIEGEIEKSSVLLY